MCLDRQPVVNLSKSLQGQCFVVTIKLKQNLPSLHISYVVIHLSLSFPHPTPKGLFCPGYHCFDHVQLLGFRGFDNNQARALEGTVSHQGRLGCIYPILQLVTILEMDWQRYFGGPMTARKNIGHL